MVTLAEATEREWAGAKAFPGDGAEATGVTRGAAVGPAQEQEDEQEQHGECADLAVERQTARTIGDQIVDF